MLKVIIFSAVLTLMFIEVLLTISSRHNFVYIFFKIKKMSQAFVKEEDDQWLHDIPGTLTALINYLTRENNGIRVYEKRKLIKNGIEVYEMSNGLSYSKDANGKWQITG
jgi:hypothetical protein